MSKFKETLAEEIAKKADIVCCGASMLGGYFIDFKRRGNYTGINTYGYSHVDDADREFIKLHNLKFFDFAALKDNPDQSLWQNLMHEHEALLHAECY